MLPVNKNELYLWGLYESQNSIENIFYFQIQSIFWTTQLSIMQKGFPLFSFDYKYTLLMC